MTNKSTIWDNKDGCAYQYRCANALYLLSMLSHSYNTVIYRGVGSPGNGKDVVDGLNATNKRFLSMFVSTMQLLGKATNNSHMVMHTSMSNTYISI